MIATLVLNSINVELQPSRNWRELARRGLKSMSYHVFGHGRGEDGKEIAVAVTIPALDNGTIADLGSEDCPLVNGLLAKTSSNIDSAKLRYKGDGSPVTDAEGHPVYDEQPIIVQSDGSEFDLRFGTLYFCTVNSAVRVKLHGVELTRSCGKDGQPSFAKDGAGNKVVPVFDASCESVEVEPRARATGRALFDSGVKIGATAGGVAQAAARATAMAAEEASDDVAM